MRFSVIIPLYNKAAYIDCTLQSVLAQDCRDFEVIVVDDGSSDDGPRIVAQCPDPRVRMLRQANAGVAVARNRGIDAARGQWVCFLDADDWLHPSYLSTLAQAQQSHPQADVVAADFVRVPHVAGSGAWPPPWPVSHEPAPVELITRLARRWMKGPSLSASSVAVRRSRLLTMQPCFAPGENLGEDLDLWFRLAEQTPIALAHKTLVAYRVEVAGSLSSSHPNERRHPFLDRLRQRAQSGDMSPQQRRDTRWLIAQHELSLAREALLAGRRRQALHWLLQARAALAGRRWWFTLLMIACMPRRWVEASLRWRERATATASNT
jgi:glycosyltransferase involved in cell wall biosynthesis